MPTPTYDSTRLAAMYERLALDAAADVRRLEARVRELEADVRAYRDVATAALDRLRILAIARERDQSKYSRLLDELRQLRSDERRAA
jgi:outer membrane murein-binding lipoprotein Lpp